MEEIKTSSRPFAPIPIEVEAIGKKVLDSAYTVHSALGPGLLESIYEVCTAYEIQEQRLKAETQVLVPVKYQSVFVETGLRLDIWVERSVIVECKAVEKMNPLYEAQLLTYLKITGFPSCPFVPFVVKAIELIEK